MDENQVGSNRLRDNFAEVLADVEHDDVSYVVMRYKKPAAVIVPVWWYEQAKLATGGVEAIRADMIGEHGDAP